MKIGEVSPVRLVNCGLLFFLFGAVLVPWDSLAKAIYYLVVVPGVVFAGIGGAYRAIARDRFIILSVLLIFYVVASSLIFGEGSVGGHLKQVRWGLESIFLVLALSLSVPLWVRSPRYYGRVFIAVVLAASAVSIFNYVSAGDFSQRLSGYGFLEHPIIGPSVLIVFWAIGASLFAVADRLHAWEYGLLVLTLAALATVCFFSMSRGPLLSLSAFVAIIFVVALARSRGVSRILLFLSLAGGFLLFVSLLASLGGGSAIDSMIARGDSYRLDIWFATFQNPPSPILFGEGAVTSFQDTPAGQSAYQKVGYPVWHPHNLFISTYFFSGIVGFVLLFLVLALAFFRIASSCVGRSVKLLMAAFLLLVVLLNASEGHRVVVSPDPIWALFWIPVVFLAIACRKSCLDVVAEHSHEVVGRGDL